CLIWSPTVNPTKLAGDAARPGPPMGSRMGTSTTFSIFFNRGTHQVLATMPELETRRPERITAWPGPVSLLAARESEVVMAGPGVQEGFEAGIVERSEAGEVAIPHLVDG